MFSTFFRKSALISAVPAALTLILTTVAPTPADANTREVRVNLKNYCSSKKLAYGGYSKKRKAFTCGVLATGFNTYYMTKLRNINLSTVCK